MGTPLEMTIDAPTPEKAAEVFEAIEKEMRRLEDMMSEWRPGSKISEVNGRAGASPVEVGQELFSVISAAMKVSEITGGAFDITWAAMRGLWDFRPGHELLPGEAEVAARVGLVDYRQVFLDPERRTVQLGKKGMAIGLGGIAKGYAVDRAMETAAGAGITNAIIRAGGDMRVQGRPSGKGGWEVGIQDPREEGAMLGRLTLTDISISTSGDYERSFVKDGVRYHHIMDPRTGWPAKGARSVTVIGPDTMTTDALSTAIFVLGPDEGLALAERLFGVEAVVVDASGGVLSTSGVDLKR